MLSDVLFRMINELRGFAPIGMMEQWNCGMMGFTKTEFKAHNFALIFLF
jgi:hypothetical protein